LLDRDGTIVHDRHYLRDPRDLELLPNAAEGLRLLADAGFGLVVVTNQSGVARGHFTAGELELQHARLRELLEAEGVALDAVYACPHGPDDGCACRKPAPGLILQAADELGLDLARSVAIGDTPRDAEAARRAGVRAVTIGADAPDLLAAAELLLQDEA
jgi:D-glycero-D-manno-heptose 1,7-bisphosphate phosphatase